jgi:hypothetical protein
LYCHINKIKSQKHLPHHFSGYEQWKKHSHLFFGAIKSLKKRMPPSLSDFHEKWLENQEINFE